MRPPEQIETERLILRKPRIDDAPAVFEGWVQDIEVTYFLTWRAHENIGQTEFMLENAIAMWDVGTRFPYIITLKENGAPIGMITIRVEPPKVELRYVMSRARQRMGYMTESTRGIIDWAFRQPSLFRVFATTNVRNIASQRVLEKAGMQREGVLRMFIVHPNINDVPSDSYMYAIVNDLSFYSKEK